MMRSSEAQASNGLLQYSDRAPGYPEVIVDRRRQIVYEKSDRGDLNSRPLAPQAGIEEGSKRKIKPFRRLWKAHFLQFTPIPRENQSG